MYNKIKIISANNKLINKLIVKLISVSQNIYTNKPTYKLHINDKP